MATASHSRPLDHLRRLLFTAFRLSFLLAMIAYGYHARVRGNTLSYFRSDNGVRRC